MSVKDQAENGALESEILRNVLDTVNHDLGGLSSALALRADVMQRTAPGPTADACSAIARELRFIGSQLRDLSGPRGSGTLSPTPMGSLERWYDLITRFGQPLLARGVSLRGKMDAVHVAPTAAHDLTFITLALLNALREGNQSAYSEIVMLSSPRDDAVAVQLQTRREQQSVPITEDPDNEWWNWAVQRASNSHISMRLVDGHIELTVARATAP